MTYNNKDKLRVLIAEAKVWADSHRETLVRYDADGEEATTDYLTISTVKWILDDIKEKFLNWKNSPQEPVCTCKASFGCKMFQDGVKYGKEAADHGWQLALDNIITRCMELNKEEHNALQLHTRRPETLPILRG